MAGFFFFRLVVLLAVTLFCSQSLLADTPVSGRTYSYDANGRLVQVVVSNGSTTTTVTYTYDQAGNLISIQ
jgi:YD repeat-containing protein